MGLRISHFNRSQKSAHNTHKASIYRLTRQEIQDFNIILSLNDISLDVGEM